MELWRDAIGATSAVGRKTRRAHHADCCLNGVAPVLSRAVRVGATRTAQNRRDFFQSELRTIGAPSFSPYRAASFECDALRSFFFARVRQGAQKTERGALDGLV